MKDRLLCCNYAVALDRVLKQASCMINDHYELMFFLFLFFFKPLVSISFIVRERTILLLFLSGKVTAKKRYTKLRHLSLVKLVAICGIKILKIYFVTLPLDILYIY